MASYGDDRELVDALRRVVKGFNQDSAANLIPGVGQSDLSRWEGKWDWITTKKRAAIEAFLDSHGGEGGARAYFERELRDLVPLTPADMARVRDLARRILEIVEGPTDLSSDAATLAYSDTSQKSLDQATEPGAVTPKRKPGGSVREGDGSKSDRARGKE